MAGSKLRVLTGLCRCPARATGGGTGRKWQHLLGMEGEENGGHNRSMGSTQQQSEEETISYGKFQATEPGHGKLLKRQRGEQGLAMADVRSKWKAEEEGLRMKGGEAEGDQTHQLHCILF